MLLKLTVIGVDSMLLPRWSCTVRTHIVTDVDSVLLKLTVIGVDSVLLKLT